MLKRLFLLILLPLSLAAQKNTFRSFRKYPFPTELNAARHRSQIAWAMNEEGKRNIYVADGPDYKPRKLTSFDSDDGLEISGLSISDDGQWVVFVRGGDHNANFKGDDPIDPSSTGKPFKVQIASIPFAGGKLSYLSEGDNFVISPDSKSVTFIKDNQVWSAPVDGSSPAAALFKARGDIGALAWSPDGRRLLFVAYRENHSIIGVFDPGAAGLHWIAPSFDNDDDPEWSPDGGKIVFIRTPGTGGAPDSMLVTKPVPWRICVADTNESKARVLWTAPATLRGSLPSDNGGPVLYWAGADHVIFVSNEDGWAHLYTIDPNSGRKTLLTPGDFSCEHVRLSPDHEHILFSVNYGVKDDLERRHIAMVSTSKPDMKLLTQGTGLEWTPTMTGDGKAITFISAAAQRPPLPAILKLPGHKFDLLSAVPATYPVSDLVVPKLVTFKSKDGLLIHADVFEPKSGSGKRPAIIYIHGGPPRQMLLGWHYSDYYSAAYASNQYLASLGFVVLSVNYRLGIGYGYDFSAPAGAGSRGASEYQDIEAAGEWLGNQPGIDASRIGVYGGSYGGYLTDLALARDSKLFSAGVAIHGISNLIEYDHLVRDRYEKAPDYEAALKTAWMSSPISALDSWRSPVLIIHGDDDRNVDFQQSIDMISRLRKQGVPCETLMIPDDP